MSSCTAGAVASAGAQARIFGLAGWDASNLLATAAGQGLQGSVSGHWVRMLHWAVNQSSSATRFLMSCFNAGGTGHRVVTLALNATLEYIMNVSGGGAVTSPTVTITAGMVGKLIDTVAVWDQPAGKVRLYHQGVEVGSGTANALAYAPNASERFAEGARVGITNPADANAIAAIEGGDGFVPSSAEILAAHTATVSRVQHGLAPFAGIAGKTTWRCQAGSAWNPPVVLTDAIGGQNLTMAVGAASGIDLVQLVKPAWAP